MSAVTFNELFEETTGIYGMENTITNIYKLVENGNFIESATMFNQHILESDGPKIKNADISIILHHTIDKIKQFFQYISKLLFEFVAGMQKGINKEIEKYNAEEIFKILDKHPDFNANTQLLFRNDDKGRKEFESIIKHIKDFNIDNERTISNLSKEDKMDIAKDKWFAIATDYDYKNFILKDILRIDKFNDTSVSIVDAIKRKLTGELERNFFNGKEKYVELPLKDTVKLAIDNIHNYNNYVTNAKKSHNEIKDVLNDEIKKLKDIESDLKKNREDKSDITYKVYHKECSLVSKQISFLTQVTGTYLSLLAKDYQRSVSLIGRIINLDKAKKED